MARMVRYTCQQEILPCIEAALAANGYAITDMPTLTNDELPPVVLECGATQVLLASCPEGIGAVEVWGDAQAVTIELLRSLPYELERDGCVQV